MKKMNFLVSIVAVFALAILSVASVSAFATISSVEINGVEAGTSNIAAFAGERLPVRVTFTATGDAEDVRVKAWLSGESALAASTGRFDVLNGSVYTRTIFVSIPNDIDPDEEFTLFVSIEDRSGVADEESFTIAAQRDSYVVEFLDVSMATKVNAGDNLVLDIVIKNRGRQLAEDTFVRVKIPALGIVEKVYFGDLSSEDQTDPDKEDTVERRLNIHIPTGTQSGIYEVEVEAFNSDSEATIFRKVAIVSGAREDTIVASAVKSRTLSVGQEGTFSLTIVNSGERVRIYEVILETNDEQLSLESEDPFVVVPAGTSQTVKFTVSADEAGVYSFTAKVYSDNELANKANYTVRAKGTSFGSGGDAAVLLTVILAIVFVVLLVVLIVLLTRKPQKVEDFGESYY